jgi:hypothetical protein
MRPVGGAVKSRVAVSWDVFLIWDLEPLSKARKASFFGFLIEWDADFEECVNREFGSDGSLVSVVGI